MKKTKSCKMRRKRVKQREPEYDGEPYILHLPEHIIVEIFCKISIKTLVKCRFVCKSWRRLFSNQQFIKDLFSQTPAYLLVSADYTCECLVDWDNASSPGDAALKVSVDLPLGRKFLGVCNGLLCHGYHYYLKSEMPRTKFYISNPITGECVPLSCSLRGSVFLCERKTTAFGFGYSPKSQVYKVVVLISFDKKVMVLTVGSGSWRCISYPGYEWEQENGIYLNGYLHWIGKCSNGSLVIHSFNLESERFEQLPMPQKILSEISSC